MPDEPTPAVIRGLMAQIARGAVAGQPPSPPKRMSNVGIFDLNKFFGTKAAWQRYRKLTRNDVLPIINELKAGPYPVSGPGAVAQFSFEYWYNYFYKELPDAERLEFAVYVINDDGSLRNEAQVPNKLSTFQRMLKLGFRPFQAADHFTAQELLAHAARDAGNELQRQNVNVVFRGDARGPERIRMDEGTKPQTRLAQLRDERNINRFWHPFNARGNEVWVRAGEVNKDNCLFSAVSVTPQFKVATKFPLLGDLIGSNPGAVGHALVSVRDRAAAAVAPASAFARARAQFAGGAAAPGNTYAMTLPASQTNVYCVRMQGAYNTQAYQGDAPFPEYASDILSWSDHLVLLKVTRIHFDAADGNAGHLIVVDECRWLQDGALISAALLGPASVNALRQFVTRTVQAGRLNDGVGGIVYTPPGVALPPFEIVKVRESFVPGRGNLSAIPAAAPLARPAPPPRRPVVVPPVFRR